MNKIYQYVEDPETNTKRIKCDLCDNTYSHHPALRYHRLREHGKFPIARKKPQKKRKNNSSFMKTNQTTLKQDKHVLKDEYIASDSLKLENDLDLDQDTKISISDLPNNTFDDDDENSVEEDELSNRIPCKTRYIYQSVVDPITKKKRIKCDLCENTYSHHPALRNHRLKAHGKFPIGRKSRKVFSRESCDSESMNNEENVKDINEIKEFKNEQLNNIKEDLELVIGDANFQQFLSGDEALTSQSVSSVNDVLLNEVPKIEYVEFPSNSLNDETNAEENMYINKSLEVNDECIQTCGVIKFSMDYTIFNINCFYCDDIFPLGSWEEFVTHLKEIHQREEERFEEVEKPTVSYSNKEFTLKIEIDHEALNKSANWQSDIHSPLDEINKSDNEDDYLKELEYKPIDEIPKASCDICKKTFRSEYRLKIHHRSRHNNGKFPDRRLAPRHCTICNKTFKHPSFYRKHINVHNPPSFKCNICDKEYRWKHSFNEHLKVHENQRDHVCELCGDSFLSNSRLRNHTKLKHADDRAYVCVICDYGCKTSMELWLHRRSNHLVLEGTIEELNKNLNEQTLSVEDNKDDNEEEINVENTKELEKYSEHTHVKEEVKEDNDKLKFKTIKTNKRNTKATKSLTVPCPLCENFFRDEDNLQNHQYRVHHVKRLDLGDRHCNICNRTFKLPSMYRNHLAVHKPPSFKCQTCGKEFRWRKSLTDHMKIHANQRDHICELCGAGFFHNIRLRDHKKMWHFDEKNYSCSFCEYTCKTATQLCQHRKKFHDNEELNKKRKKKYPSQRKPKGSRAPKYQYVVDPDTKVKLLKCDLCDNTYSHHPALRYHRFNAHGKIPIQSRKSDQQNEYQIESTLEQEVIDLLTSENQSDIAVEEEIIHFPDDLIVYDATEEV